MPTFRNGHICYFKKSKKKFWRTLVQGGRGGQPQSVQVRTGGEGGPKSGNFERTYFMDAPYVTTDIWRHSSKRSVNRCTKGHKMNNQKKLFGHNNNQLCLWRYVRREVDVQWIILWLTVFGDLRNLFRLFHFRQLNEEHVMILTRPMNGAKTCGTKFEELEKVWCASGARFPRIFHKTLKRSIPTIG